MSRRMHPSSARRPRQAGRSAPVSPSLGPPSRTRLVLATFAAAAVLVVAVIAFGAFLRGRESNPAAPLTTTAPIEGRVLGAASAPVTIIEFADYQCPNCARFTQTTEREIEARYITTGKVKLEVRHFPFLGQESFRAAEASECAGEQGQFFKYRAALYAAQAGENRGAFSDRNLRAIADRAGLDGDALAACLASGRYRDRVQEDLRQARALNVEATPTFFINGVMIVGAQPLPVFVAAIEQALAGPRR